MRLRSSRRSTELTRFSLTKSSDKFMTSRARTRSSATNVEATTGWRDLRAKSTFKWPLMNCTMVSVRNSLWRGTSTAPNVKVQVPRAAKPRHAPSARARDKSKWSKTWASCKCRCNSLVINARVRDAPMRKTVLLARDAKCKWSQKLFKSTSRKEWQTARR